MSCSNCFNGCAEIVSDKCIKFTGLSNTPLSINTGDTLLSIEETLINNVANFITGAGINITLDPTAYCTLVSSYLTGTGPHSLIDLVTALVKAACSLQTQVTAIDAEITTLNSTYTIVEGCPINGYITTITPTTHDVLQATISAVCTINTTITALSAEVSTNYVRLADLNSLIAAYISSTSTSTQNYLKMIPYTAVEYYGPLSNFDLTGKGISGNNFDKIYLCNGLNGTPDKRGRVTVGAIVSVPGGALDAEVDPAVPGNPNYSLYGKAGVNSIILTATQIPSHTHATTVTEVAHSHFTFGESDTTADVDNTHAGARFHSDGGNLGYRLVNSAATTATIGKTNAVSTGLSVSNANTGGGLSHANNQPAIAANYIMYIP